MSTLHQQLMESVREMESIREGIKYAVRLSTRLEEEERALEELEEKLTKEQRDVHTLERENVTSFIRKFIGDREEKLEKEKGEYLDVSQRHIELYKSIELMRYELGILKSKEDFLESIELKVAILLREREKELISSDLIFADLIKNLNEEGIKHHTYIKKLERLKSTVDTALSYVTSIAHRLSEARDHLMSNKAGSALLVDDALDHARRPLQKATQLLLRFQKELRSIFPEMDLDTQIHLEKFDSHTQSFLSDSTFREKINTSRKNVEEIIEQVEIVRYTIDQEISDARDRLAAIEEERKRLIISANSAP